MWVAVSLPSPSWEHAIGTGKPIKCLSNLERGKEVGKEGGGKK